MNNSLSMFCVRSFHLSPLLSRSIITKHHSSILIGKRGGVGGELEGNDDSSDVSPMIPPQTFSIPSRSFIMLSLAQIYCSLVIVIIEVIRINGCCSVFLQASLHFMYYDILDIIDRFHVHTPSLSLSHGKKCYRRSGTCIHHFGNDDLWC
jgi:hypothetical protein